METFNEDPRLFDPNNPYAGDERLPIQFYMGTLQDDNRTAAEGRPIYLDVECIRIFNSKDNIVDRPVRDTDKQRWPKQYAAWKASGASEPGMMGTRLEHWPAVTRAQAEELKYFKVFTVEQLSELPDSTGQRIMGFAKLKNLAKLYLEAARGEAPLIKMQQELELRDGAITELTNEVKRLTEMVKKVMEKHGDTANV